MASVKLAFGTATDITCTLASLAEAASRESTAIDNSTNLYLDAEVYLAIALQAGTPASEKTIYIYAYASADGTNFDDNATGSDASITLRSPTNLKLLDVINCPDSGGLTYKKIIKSVASAFGGVLPPKWGLVILNKTNIALSATEGDHTKKYRGVYATVS